MLTGPGGPTLGTGHTAVVSGPRRLLVTAPACSYIHCLAPYLAWAGRQQLQSLSAVAAARDTPAHSVIGLQAASQALSPATAGTSQGLEKI
jgi:hypothetical protein